MGKAVWFIISALVAVLDQASKYLIIKNLKYNEMIPVIDKFFYITYHENSGAAWGILQNKGYILIPLTIILCIGIIYMLIKADPKILNLSLSFILGGAVGNLIDRILKARVVDFLDFYFGSYNFPTFNVADMFITIGTVILAVFVLFFYEEGRLFT